MATISTALARKACRIDYTDQDDVLEMLTAGLDEYIERETGLTLTASDEVENVEGGGFGLWPSKVPVNSVTEVYDNESGLVESTSDWHLRKNGIYRDSDSRWDRGRANRWRVTYNGGYASTSVIPAGLKMIMMELVTLAYHGIGGKEAVESAGYNVDFGEYMDSRMMAQLEVYRTARSRFG